MFSGEFEYRLDPQGRVSIPPRFRPALSQGLIATRGYDRCVVVFTPQAWVEFSAEVAAKTMHRQKNRLLARFTFAGAFELELDRQGRVLLPIPLRRYANIQEDVVVAGVGNYMEIWDRTEWQEIQRQAEETAAFIAEGTEERP